MGQKIDRFARIEFAMNMSSPDHPAPVNMLVQDNQTLMLEGSRAKKRKVGQHTNTMDSETTSKSSSAIGPRWMSANPIHGGHHTTSSKASKPKPQMGTNGSNEEVLTGNTSEEPQNP